MTIKTARQEWASGWPLPVVAMLGNAGSTCFAFSGGVFMTALTQEFGWSRAQFSSAFTVQMLLGLIVVPFIGPLIDRVGPRKVALIGILPFVFGFSLLGLVNGPYWQWLALCGVQVFFAALIGPTVWVKAVISRFSASRGVALAVVMAGVGLGAAVWPILAAYFLQHLGWRGAFPALALSWGVIMLPLTYLYFFGASDAVSRSAPDLSASGLLRLMRTRAFVLLTVAGSIFKAATFGLTLHLVPVLQGKGLDLTDAAAIAAMFGIFGIAGRLGAGVLLDIMPTRPLNIAMFLLPILVSILLWNAQGSYLAAAIAVAVLGISTGAESDIIGFMVARHFDHRVFASVYSYMMASVSVCASLGPLIAGFCFDRQGTYDSYLLVMGLLAGISALLMAFVPSAHSLDAEPSPTVQA